MNMLTSDLLTASQIKEREKLISKYKGKEEAKEDSEKQQKNAQKK